ncbi:MAG: hypothetical protein CME26_07015 [Gemmatimonadetes bacterium]|nr:hypothetical protein [Gemmatimonadota bacterium]|tara:strand:- start:1581 stop:2903 length:1323 start_codon:yes stop_codon:yes gene_type:complete
MINRSFGILVAGALIEGGLLGLLGAGDLRQNVYLYFFCFAVSFFSYLFAVRIRSSASLHTILLFGVLFRLTVLLIEPSLSDDIHRYVWDGAVQKAGIDPYRFPPDAIPADVAVRIEGDRTRVNHAHLPTIYPPASQLFFRIAAYPRASLWSVKVWIIVFDLLGAWFIVGLLRTYGLDQRAVLLYLWNPLLLTEGGMEGHVDVVGATVLVLCLLYGQVSGPGRAAFALALSTLVKIVPAAAFPLLWRWSTSGEDADLQRRLRAMLHPRGWVVPAVFCATCVVFYLPHILSGAGVLGSLDTYLVEWEFNGLVFGAVLNVAGDGTIARMILFGFFALFAFGLALSGVPAPSGFLALIVAYLLLSPTFYPWYALWIVPFLPFFPQAWAIALTGSAAISHHVLIEYGMVGVWRESTWVAWLVWAGPALVGLVEWRRNTKRKGRLW